MISYIKGSLEKVSENSIVVENNGIGYEILVPMSVTDRIAGIGSEVKIFTYMYVREDLIQLFGFLDNDCLEVFKLLITVSGIGPKGALGILSVMSADDLRFAVLADDAKSIAKAPGIGAKTAGKIVLELKDKLKLKDIVEDAIEHGIGRQTEGDAGEGKKIISEAVEALIALGYPAADAMRAVRSVDVSLYSTVEELLKLSLKEM